MQLLLLKTGLQCSLMFSTILLFQIIQAPFCGEIKCEDKIKKDSARLVILIIECFGALLSLLIISVDYMEHLADVSYKASQNPQPQP